SLAVNPASGRVTVVGTDATNEVRFEPVLEGRFLRVQLAAVDPAAPATLSVIDLNPHITASYGRTIPFVPLPQDQRELSIGDPRAVVWNAAGTRGWVAGMGSANVVEIDAGGARVGGNNPIVVGAGPAGLALDEARGRLYVLNRFESTISTVDIAGQTELLPRAGLFDSTPQSIRLGRDTLYDTHLHSGLGHIS
ncbi:MAG: hypothetical protein HZB38_11880, partial [Planctomycetes bacterium]|nr:hypothetical protein [Planctomycetota bacterium]